MRRRSSDVVLAGALLLAAAAPAAAAGGQSSSATTAASARATGWAPPRPELLDAPHAPSQAGSLAEENPWRFQGRRWDPETGWGFFRLRYLDAGAGRWVSRDPLGIWGDPGQLGNAYSAFGNDPVNSVDPWGLDAFAAASALNSVADELDAAASSGGPAASSLSQTAKALRGHASSLTAAPGVDDQFLHSPTYITDSHSTPCPGVVVDSHDVVAGRAFIYSPGIRNIVIHHPSQACGQGPLVVAKALWPGTRGSPSSRILTPSTPRLAQKPVRAESPGPSWVPGWAVGGGRPAHRRRASQRSRGPGQGGARGGLPPPPPPSGSVPFPALATRAP